MTTDLDRTAVEFSRAWASRRQFDFRSLSAPRTPDEAYEIQDRVFAGRFPGCRAVAWKAGASSPDGESSAAPIGEVHQSPAVLEATNFHMYGIEAETALRIDRDLPQRAGGWTDEELADAVGEIVVTIELCDTRLAGWKAASPLWRLADFQLNGALVVGSGQRDWRGLDFAAQPVELWMNGIKKVARVGSHPMGTPLRVLPWIAAHCAGRSGGLKRGDLVTTGSWTGMEFASPGDQVTARFPGIGEASLKIA
jgi:2-keto-4-pentenoate hydratase